MPGADTQYYTIHILRSWNLAHALSVVEVVEYYIGAIDGIHDAK